MVSNSSSMTLKVKLPQDVIYYIASLIIEDRNRKQDAIKDLKACALVSKDWHHATKPYIFRRIVVRDQASLDELGGLLDAQPELKSLIRELTLRGSMIEDPETEYAAPTTAWALKAPLRLSCKLPRLHTIRFEELFDLMFKPNREFFEGLSKLTTVQNISLLRCGTRADFIFRCAGALPGLRTVDVVDALALPAIFTGPISFDPTDCSALFPEATDLSHLTRLRFWNSLAIQYAVLPKLLSPTGQSALRSLRAEVHEEALPALLSVANQVGQNLETLVLQLPHCCSEFLATMEASGHTARLLGPCTALKEVGLHVTFLEETRCAHSVASSLLRNLRSPSLEEVDLQLATYTCTCAHDRTVDTPDFTPLAHQGEDNHATWAS